MRSESQMRAKRDVTVDRLQEQLKLKVIASTRIVKNTFLVFCFQEDELNQMRTVLDQSDHHHHHTTTKSIPDRTKSAPHFNGFHRRVNNDND